MNILSFGSFVESGTYHLHSKFSKVQNYTKDSNLISLVAPEIGKGPNNIVLTQIPEFAKKSINVANEKIKIGDKLLKRSYSDYEQENDLYIHNIKSLSSKSNLLASLCKPFLSSKSFGFLLDANYSSNFKTSYELALLKKVNSIMENFSFFKLPEITKKIKGIGFGLTPSGDDLNCGILYALNYSNEIVEKDLSVIIKKCYQNSIGNNIISNNFLKFAFQNQYYENFYGLLKAMKQNNNQKLSYYIKKVINSGHTSGSDMITGFILTLKGGINDKKLS